MKNSSYLIWNVFLGLLLWVQVNQAARATSLIYAKNKATTTAAPNVTQDELTTKTTVPSVNETAPANVTKLTGIPQIDYVLDPNLPRELNGHNLTLYPFYNSIPEEIDFKCDGLHDGFYASVTHHCQVYHHCLFGTRYDFLCANYTAFDQRTFICHFASEVDCKNSPKHYNRNEALYKAATTTTIAPLTTLSPNNGRRRRPYRRRKPTYDYYDEYSDYSEDYEDDDRRGEGSKRPKSPNKEPPTSDEEPLPTGPNKALYDRPRVAPKVRRPVPVNERDKYDYSSDSRVIPTKSSQEESTVAEDDKTDTNKRKNNPRAQEAESSKGRDRERQRDRDRFRDRDEDEDVERDRAPPVRDDGDRDRARLRDDDRERDRERPRNRRPAKKRKRPDPYDYYDDYEEARRPKPKERPRYDETEDDEDDEYDDRYYRKPLRGRDQERPRERDRDRDRERDRDRDRERNRERDRERDRGREREREKDHFRTKDDEETPRGKSRRREYEDEDEKYVSRESAEKMPARDQESGSRKSNWRDSDGPKEDNFSPKKQLENSSKGAIDKSAKTTPKPEDTYSEETSETDSHSASYEETSVAKEKVPDAVEKIGDNSRGRLNFRSRTSTVKTPTKMEPVPAARPAYITPVKKAPEISRKPTGFRRPTTQRYSSEADVSVEKEYEISREVSTEKPLPKKNYAKQEELKINVPGPTAGSFESENTSPKQITTADEDLVPRAPKVPFMSNRRRPFLPSRGGDPSLLRGLTPVGAKAFTTQKKEDAPSPPAPTSRERFTPKVEPSRFTAPIEFRTRVGANLGVEQPKLRPVAQEESYSQEEDYSEELIDSEESRKEDFAPRAQSQQTITRQEIFRSADKLATPLRPILRTTDFPQLSLAGGYPDMELHSQVQKENKDRKYSSRLPSSNNNQYLAEQPQPKLQIYQPSGPQTFFSDNPKFHTAVPLSDAASRQRQQNTNFQPAFYQPIVKSGQGQVQVVHFQKTVPSPAPRNPALRFPQEHLEDTDEYDVSFNDALQPISSLHPRNAQTGVIDSQRASPRRRVPFNAPEDSRTSPKNDNPRLAATVIHSHLVPSPQSYNTRNIHSEIRQVFAR